MTPNIEALLAQLDDADSTDHSLHYRCHTAAAALREQAQEIEQAWAMYDVCKETRAAISLALKKTAAERDTLRAQLATQAAEIEALRKAGDALANAARSLAGDIGTHHEAWIWDKLDEWDAALMTERRA